MGIAERKSREKEERKRLILDYAKELILEQGVGSVTMLDIAKKAELSKATLYLYFKSKEAILEEILEEAGTYFMDYVQERIDFSKPGIELFRDLWESFIHIYGENNDIFVCIGIKNYLEPGFPLVMDRSLGNEERVNIRFLRLIRDTLSRGVEDGTLDKAMNPEKLASSIMMIGSGIIETVSRLPRSMRNTRHILNEMQSTFELILRGAAAEGTPRELLTLRL
jgi:AcrR family transcriptional regulator